MDRLQRAGGASTRGQGGSHDPRRLVPENAVARVAILNVGRLPDRAMTLGVPTRSCRHDEPDSSRRRSETAATWGNVKMNATDHRVEKPRRDDAAFSAPESSRGSDRDR